MDRRDSSSSFTFAGFRLDPGGLSQLDRAGSAKPVVLGSRALDLLRVLVERHGEIVSKDTIVETVWMGMAVEESNLTVQISTLRRILDRDRPEGSCIQTIPGRGYQFVAAIRRLEDAAAPSPGIPLPDKPSIAVLPFTNMSGDPDQEYFADGMVEEITTALSGIGWLFVIARNSAFTYKGRNVDAKQVGRELGVRYLLEGSVRKGGGRVRITVQLIDAGTAAHLWADRFDGSLEDVFELQDRVASSTAAAIEPTLQTAEIRRSDQRPTDDLTSYDLYLRALAHHLSYDKDRVVQALDLLGRAIVRDPNYGQALALAAYCHAQLDLIGWTDDADMSRRAGLDLARRALQVAADDPDVLAQVAYLLVRFGERVEVGIELIDRALAFRPGFAHGWYWSGYLRLMAGRPDQAIEHFERCRRLSPRDPLEPRFLTGIAAAHFFNRRFVDAARLLLVALEQLPAYVLALRYLAATYAHLERFDEARAIITRLRRITSDFVGNARILSNAEHRELLLYGMRLATGEEGGIETNIRRPGSK